MSTPGQFSDEQTKAILARAIELDALAPTTTADELRTLAADIGISTTSLEAALREQATAVETQRTIAGRRAATMVVGLEKSRAVGECRRRKPGDDRAIRHWRGSGTGDGRYRMVPS